MIHMHGLGFAEVLSDFLSGYVDCNGIFIVDEALEQFQAFGLSDKLDQPLACLGY